MRKPSTAESVDVPPRRAITVDDAEELTQAVALTMAGGWRTILHYQRMGIPQLLGLSTREWVDKHLGGYIRMSMTARREAVAELTEDGLSQREIADVLGVSQGTVLHDVRADELSSAVPPIPQPDTESEYADDENSSVIPEGLPAGESRDEHGGTYLPLLAESLHDTNAVHYRSDSDEWYTPPHIVGCVIATMGAIDLDPCSNSRATPTIPARRHFTIDDDGLAQEWHGRVYVNPPYGRVIDLWID